MALYLKYRPKDFESIVGQDFVKNTLKKAVEQDKTVGAYLLCGPRGTGKTSTARILAKAVNCTKSQDGNPCNSCDFCNAINTESLVDIIEIDAASNTGVDNIRELISKAQFRPTSAKYKIYIIDEVHMLSKGAFNALLKILEEPPVFVKFILATTETHKVPETIISRCQRYDFKNISELDLKNRLEYIAEKEGIKIEEQAINYIAKNSAGGLRNAISLFEQMISNSSIIYENIINILGLIPEEKLELFLDKLIKKENSIIEDFDELISSGKNIKLFFKDLIFYTKNKTLELVKNKQSISELLFILEELNETYSKTKNTLDENTTFLIGILKILNSKKPLSGFFSPSQEKESTKTEKKHDNKILNEIKEEKIEVKNEIEVADIGDVFGKSLEEKNNNSSIFDKKLFTEKLKELGAKGGLTMGIRGAECYNNGKTLELKFPTLFALKGANTLDNISLIKQALEKMNISELEVKLI